MNKELTPEIIEFRNKLALDTAEIEKLATSILHPNSFWFEDVCQEMRIAILSADEGLNREFYFQAAKCQAIDFLRKMNPQKPESED